MKPVIAPPLLPYPSGNDIKSLRAFDADLRRSLVEILTQYAFRLNGMLPSDGSEPANGGILFPATQIPSANPNILDDYREISWTPTLAFGGASVGITYSVQEGTTIKIGRVFVTGFHLTLTSKGSSVGTAQVVGSPILSGNGQSMVGFGGLTAAINMLGLTSTPYFVQGNVVNTMPLRHMNATGQVDLTDANFANNTLIRGMLVGISAT